MSGLPARQVSRFTVWCLSRMSAEFGADVWGGLTETEKEALQGILHELEADAQGQSALPAGRASELAEIVENFGPRDEVRAIEVLADAVEMREAVWHALQYAHTGDAAHACAVSEALINLWDFHAGSAYESYCLEDMFIFPELRREVELQGKFIEALS